MGVQSGVHVPKGRKVFRRLARFQRRPSPQIIPHVPRSAPVRSSATGQTQNRARPKAPATRPHRHNKGNQGNLPKIQRRSGQLSTLLRAIAQACLSRHGARAAEALAEVVGNKSAAQLAPSDVVIAAADYARHAPWTRYQRASCFRKLLRNLAAEFGAPDLSAVVPKVVPPRPRNVTASDDERTRIMQAAPLHLRAFLLLCSDMAMRSGTAVRISPNHYDAATGNVSYSTKFGDKQTLPATAELRAIFAVANGPKDVPYVVQLNPRGSGGLRTNRTADNKSVQSNLQAQLKRLRFALGISKRIIPHDLRRTTAVRVYEDTHDLRAVQHILGHRGLPQTLHYLDHAATSTHVDVLESAKLPRRFDA